MPTVAGKTVGPTGYGLLGFTQRRETQIPQSQAFAAMSAAFDAGTYLWNGGEFYGTRDRNTLHLLNEYFTKFPEKADKVVVVMKGGIDLDKFEPDGRESEVRRSVDECVRVLNGKKAIDVFECSRVDPKVPIEDTLRILKALKEEGKIKNIGLSEVKAESILRAVKVVPIATVEVELSLWSREILHNGVASTCAALGIPILAYSPLSRGMLSPSVGAIRKNSDLPQHLRSLYPKLADGALQVNARITEEVQKLAKRKGCSMTQLALGWIRTLSGRNGLGTIIPIPGAEKAEWVEENCVPILLSDEEMAELEQVLEPIQVMGNRYNDVINAFSEG